MSATVRTSVVPGLARGRATFDRLWVRIDRALLRLQGRVDTPAYDQWLPYGFAILQAALLIVLVLARYNSLDLGTETAKYTQAVWQIGEGFKPDTTLAGGNILADQGSLILYPLAVVTAVVPRTQTLLVIKAMALSVTIIPLWRLARRHGLLGIGATSSVIFAYSIYSAVHAMNAADFAPAILAVPALMWAALAGFDEKNRTMILAIVFALMCRGDLGLAVAGLGVLLLIERRRRVGLIALGVGFAWFLIAVYGLQPYLGDGDYAFLSPYAAFGDTPHGVLWGIISHPIRFAQIVGSVANFQVLVTLLAPVLFLPLTAPRFLMPAVPLYVLYMGAAVPEGRLREAAQTVPITVFVFVATVFALRRTGRILVKRVRVERRIVLALLLTALVFFVRDSVTSPYQEPWQWGRRDTVDQARLAAVELVPSDELPVRASASVLPLLSERFGVYELNTQVLIGAEFDLDAIISAAVADVDWLIIDRDAEPALTGGDTYDRFSARLRERGWQFVERNDEDRIDVYEFTGIISAPPAAQAAEVQFGISEPEEEEEEEDGGSGGG